MAKIDMLLQFFICIGWWSQLRLIRTGLFRYYALSAVFAALALVTKLDYSMLASLVIAMTLRPAAEGVGSIFAVVDRRFLGSALIFGATALTASPFWLLDIQKNLEAVGWLYFMSTFLSFYHTDPHHWWLDRYFYNYLLIVPFLLGIPLYVASIVGAAQNLLRSRWKPEILLFINLIGFAYLYPSQAEGSYAYYLHIHLAPLLVVFASGFIKSLWEKRAPAFRAAAAAIFIFITAVGILRLDSYYSFSAANFEKLGPWVEENIPAGSKALLFSVYLPGKGLGVREVERVWPQDLSPELLKEKYPDYIILDTWDFGGFKKYYRDISPVERHLKELVAGNMGYKVIKRIRTRYFGDWFYKRLDPEHDVELLVLEREGGPPGKGVGL